MQPSDVGCTGGWTGAVVGRQHERHPEHDGSIEHAQEETRSMQLPSSERGSGSEDYSFLSHRIEAELSGPIDKTPEPDAALPTHHSTTIQATWVGREVTRVEHEDRGDEKQDYQPHLSHLNICMFYVLQLRKEDRTQPIFNECYIEVI